MIHPCISLKQPYASLCFVDDPALRKIHETRGRNPFPAKYQGQRIAIQASLQFWNPFPRGLHDLCVAAFGWDYRQSLPRGAVLGTVLYVSSAPTIETEPASPSDLIAGGWAEGRYAMRLADPVRLAGPIPCKGHQGWFSIDVPEAA